MDDRIRLAEAMGFICQHCDNGLTYQYDDAGRKWKFTCAQCGGKAIPDPFTDANDCEALIRFLNERGVMVEITCYGDGLGHQVLMVVPKTSKSPAWEGDDYKQGVCELALKVISDE